MDVQVSGYVPYVEPSLVSILSLGSFLILANVFGFVVERFIHAGLLGQIAIGVIYGTPLGNILDSSWEQTFLTLGYIGLLLIVFECGLTTPLNHLFKSLPLACFIAAVGVLFPIGISMALMVPRYSYSVLEAFVAGAALSVTSLGTTVSVLKAANKSLRLQETRIGTVLIAAAMIDDIVAFVMNIVIADLGESNSGLDPWHIAQPIVTSIAFLVVAFPITRWIFIPVYRQHLHQHLLRSRDDKMCFVIIVAVLSAGVSIASLIHSSPLMGAYVAGLIVAVLPPELSKDEATQVISPQPSISAEIPSFECRPSLNYPVRHPIEPESIDQVLNNPFVETYERLFEPVSAYIFTPIFFASIGTAVPFVSLWEGTVVWQGVVYAILMVLAKMSCGICVLIWDLAERALTRKRTAVKKDAMALEEAEMAEIQMTSEEDLPTEPEEKLAIYPALFLGISMVPRGEIGVLIAQVGYNKSKILGNDAFLVVLWGIALATIIGPIAIGFIVKRMGHKVAHGRWS
ncbi:Predicted K /H-antiporter [Phaffia rhodozyma]|uniref:Predicted K /H-antiporter n=1 Tax=Phaffia rhodozyma TaxID=264483 RepID=A0A0F7SH80_PHARH|nr:Predicted K /H-antiporter [Phaffia rhodozyma]